MSRLITVLALVGLWTSVATAQEKSVGFISTELQAAARNAAPNQESEPPSPSDAVPEGAPVVTPGAGTGLDANCFYPAHDAGCGIPSLVNHCNCDPTCRETDQWCDQSGLWSPGNKCYLGEDCWLCNDTWNDVSDPRLEMNDTAVRLGFWSMSNKGSPNMTGQYQDLNSSLFWDVDMLRSNGTRTLDFTLTGLNEEGQAARGYFYGPWATANVRYQGFLNRLGHEPLYGFDLNSGTPGPTDNVVTRDFNPSADYAVRVQMLDTKFKGDITENLKWTLNVWGMRKFGERQADAVAHCFNMNAGTSSSTLNIRCHVISQQQNIDWITTQIEPGLEARYDNVSVQFTHMLRTFGQNDEIVTRDYTRFGYTAVNNGLGPPYVYSLAPENVTNIERLKISADLNESNQVYANGFYGGTHNTFRDTTRQYSGVDLRWINKTVDNVTITTYGGYDQQNNDVPSVAFVNPPLGTSLGNAAQREPASLAMPVDYLYSRMGIRGSWQPFKSPFEGDGVLDRPLLDGLSIVSGYEYSVIARNNQWMLGTTPQGDTKTHLIELGPYMQWSQQLNSYVRYKGRLIEDPLTGVTGTTEFNTNQPTQDHRIEIGGSWAPTKSLYATAQLSIVNAWNDSQYAVAPPANSLPIHFTENNYPVTTTLFYAPTDRLALNAGYGYFSNWITQNIATGGPNMPYENTPWSYQGWNHIASFGANYNVTNDFSLTGGYEWNRGSNSFANPMSATGADWTLGAGLASYSAVLVETQRYTAGFDWKVYRQTSLYTRYNYFDYNDIQTGLNSGTTHMLLTGVTLVR